MSQHHVVINDVIWSETASLTPVAAVQLHPEANARPPTSRYDAHVSGIHGRVERKRPHRSAIHVGAERLQ